MELTAIICDTSLSKQNSAVQLKEVNWLCSDEEKLETVTGLGHERGSHKQICHCSREPGFCYKEEKEQGSCWWETPASVVTIPSLQPQVLTSLLKPLPSNCCLWLPPFPSPSSHLSTASVGSFQKGCPWPHRALHLPLKYSFLLSVSLACDHHGVRTVHLQIRHQLLWPTYWSSLASPQHTGIYFAQASTLYSGRPFPNFIKACPALMTSRALFDTPTWLSPAQLLLMPNAHMQCSTSSVPCCTLLSSGSCRASA